MSLYQRLKRRMGHDTTTEIVHEEPRYRYEVEHINGVRSVEEGNNHMRDEGFLLILEKNDDEWAQATFCLHMSYTGPPGLVKNERGFNVVRELNGIQEVNKDRIGTDRWIFTVDKADETWIGTEKEYEEIECD
jgi:hypothetical protein